MTFSRQAENVSQYLPKVNKYVTQFTKSFQAQKGEKKKN